MFCDNIFALRNRIFKVTLKTLQCTRRYSSEQTPELKPFDDTSHLSERIMRPALQPSQMLLQVLGCGAPGSCKSLFVSTSNTSYIFNCGEGMQRAAFEYRYKVVKSNNVFVTTPVWSNIGGLPGYVLTAEKAGQMELNIYGPDGTADIMEAIKNFVTFKTMTVKNPSLDKNEIGNFEYVDSNMKVECVPLARMQVPLNDKEMISSDLVLDDINYYDYRNENNKRPSPSTNVSNKMRKLQIDLKKGRINSSMAYICKLGDKPGALDFAKCVELGITPGPVLGKLKAGESVTLPNGKVVTNKEVCREPSPGPVFIVVDCYDEVVLDSLLKNKSFDKHFVCNNPETDLMAYCIVHFTPEDIMQNAKYKEWMSKFGDSTKHLIINDTNNCVGSEAVNMLQRELNLLHPDIFPLLADEKNDLPQEVSDDYNPKEDGLTVYRAKNNDRISLRPLTGFDRMHVTLSDLDTKVQELSEVDGLPEHLEEFQKTLQDKVASMGPTEEYPKIVVLGTGSSIPCKTRNTSGLLLQISETSSMILDCGEATILQLFKFFGKDECYRILSTLKGIYISHLHADHHIGLIGILNHRRKVNKDPVYLFAPEQINGWLHFYNAKFEEILSQLELISNKNFFIHKHAVPLEIKNKIFNNLELSDLNTTFVKHCAYSYGVALTLANNKKIVYSGDTMPCDSLVMMGHGCDLLIHEATHEDDMATEAKLKRHSTLSQAITAGHKMQAKYILLTHFSQRYAKIPRVIENETDLSNVGFAYDMMQVRFSQLALLPMFYSTLRIIFSEFYRELEIKAEKRLRTKEKLLSSNVN